MIKTKILFILLSFCFLSTLSGCIASRELRKKKRALKHIEKARKISPEVFQADTVFIHDTVTIEREVHDTTTTVIYHDTTTVINNDRMIVKYMIDTNTREIHHFAECKEQVRVVNKPVIVEKIVPLSYWERLKLNFVSYLPILAIVVLFLLIIWFKK